MSQTELTDETERLLEGFRGGYASSPKLSGRTGEIYARNTRQFFESTEATPSTVTTDDIQDHLSRMGLDDYAPKTIQSRYNAVRQFMDWYADRSTSDRDDNPALDVDKKQRGGKGAPKDSDTGDQAVALDPEEIELLCENVPEPVTRNELMIRLLYRSGLRQSEIRNLKKKQFHHNESPIRIKIVNSKGGKSRTTWAVRDNRLDTLVERWLNLGVRASYANAKSSPYLFLTDRSDQLSRNQPNRVVKKAAANAGLQETLYTDQNGGERKRVTVHALRHSFAKSCVQSDNGGSMDLARLQRLMGHEKIQTTREQYLHFKEDELRDAIQMHGAGIERR